MRSRDKAKRAYRSRKEFVGPRSTMIVTKNKRSVRITIVSLADEKDFNYIDLSDAHADRLIRRLTAIRGGRNADRVKRKLTYPCGESEGV